ncbi:MAG: hypothetical protein AAF828_03855 [Bacteroidota bacterium]
MMQDQLSELEQSLRQRPDVECWLFESYPGLTDEEMDALERSTSKKIPPILREFYRTTNGLRVNWVDQAQNKQEQGRKAFERRIKNGDWWVYQSDYYEFAGVIQILPLDLLLTTTGEDQWWYPDETSYEIDWNGHTVDRLAATKNIRLLDVYSKYNTIGLYWPPSGEEAQIVFGDDHEATFFDHASVPLETYFTFLWASAGAIKERDEFLEKHCL